MGHAAGDIRASPSLDQGAYLGPDVVVSALIPVRAVPREVVRAHRRFRGGHLVAEPTRRAVAAGAVQKILAYLSRAHGFVATSQARVLRGSARARRAFSGRVGRHQILELFEKKKNGCIFAPRAKTRFLQTAASLEAGSPHRPLPGAPGCSSREGTFGAGRARTPGTFPARRVTFSGRARGCRPGSRPAG